MAHPWARKEPEKPAAQIASLDGVRASRYAARALEDELTNLLGTSEGERNNALNRAAFNLGTLIGAGHLARPDVEDQLRAIALRIGLSQSETEATIASGIGAGIREPRQIQIREDKPEIEEVGAYDLAPADEEAFWSERELLRHLHTFARARRVSPWAVLGVALARIVTVTPYTVCLPPIIGGRGSLNLYVGLVGPSGGGKGASEAAATDALELGYIRSARIASGEAIAHVYKSRGRGAQDPEWRDESHAALISIPEIDRLGGQAQRQGSTIMADLRSAWSGEHLGQIAADASRSIPLEAHQYRMGLVAGIQPHRAGVLLDDADGGTPQRFVWLPVLDPDVERDPSPAPPALEWSAPRRTHDGYISVCAAAEETIKDAHVARHRGEGDPLDAHALQCRLKVAAALGVADGRYEVNAADWRLSELIMQKSAATRTGVVEALRAKGAKVNRDRAEAEASRAVIVEERKAESAAQRAGRAIVRRLRREGGWMPAGALCNGITQALRPYFEEAIENLVEAGQIEQEQGGRSERYRLREDL